MTDTLLQRSLVTENMAVGNKVSQKIYLNLDFGLRLAQCTEESP